MTKVRQDAWSHEDDLLLAETVLRHIREGSTQLNAFEEVGDRLDRTGAACGFRWNAIVRKKYEQAVSIAKRQRKNMKRRHAGSGQISAFKVNKPAAFSIVNPATVPMEKQIEKPVEKTVPTSHPIAEEMELHSTEVMTLDKVISFLNNLNQETSLRHASLHENEQLKMELDRLKSDNESLQKENEALLNKQKTMEEDYQSIIQIMERARKMVMFQDNDNIQPATSPTFKMDKNGNLEKMA